MRLSMLALEGDKWRDTGMVLQVKEWKADETWSKPVFRTGCHNCARPDKKMFCPIHKRKVEPNTICTKWEKRITEESNGKNTPRS